MEEKKQIKVSLGAVISVFIIILLTVALVGMYCYYNFVVIPKYEVANNEPENIIENEPNNNINDEENEVENNENTQIENEEDDVYGYALMSYAPGDGSFNEFYRIVELHKNSDDVIIAKYDVNKRNSVDKPSGVRILKSVNNKLYYALYYNLTESGILEYGNIMCIDLNSEDKTPVEVLNWKQSEANYNKTIMDYNVTSDGYIYFNTRESKFYKYNMSSKESKEISETEYRSTYKDAEVADVIDELYINGKKVSIDRVNKQLSYDSKVIYTSKEGPINLLYSFDNKIIISESYNMTEVSVDVRYYEYNIETNIMKEIDITTNPIYVMGVISK